MKKKVCLTILLLITFITPLFISENIVLGNAGLKKLEQKFKDNEEKIKEAQKNIKASNAKIAQLQAQILEIEKELNKLQQEKLEIEYKIKDKEQEIEATKELLAKNMAKQEKFYALAKKRIKIMYEYGDTDYLEVLFTSTSASDFFNRLEYLNKLVEYDKGILDKIAANKLEIEENEKQLNFEKQELVDLQKENTAKINKENEIITQKGKLLEKAEEDKETSIANEKALKDEEAKIDSKIKELLAILAYQASMGDGSLDWPTPGRTYISSKFGPRIHPVHGYKGFHTGIDIPIPYGGAIYASASGKVIFAGWNTAYGNMILIDHGTNDSGQRVVTQYAHNSALLVSVGDIVVRGDHISKAGSTGWSTGNHLHFGVQIDGKWKNPLDFAVPK